MDFNIALFRQRLREEREYHGWSQATLAKKSHLHPNVLWKLEHEDRPGMLVVTVVRLAKALRVTTDYLLGLTDE